MASKDYKIRLDNEEFKRQLRDTQQMVARNKLMMERDLNIRMTDLQAKTQQAVTEETNRTTEALREGGRETTAMTSTLGRAGKLMAGLFSVRVATQFASTLANVRGEFQQLEISFGTMLKSTDKANKLMAQLTETAAKTPFDMQGVTQGAKQLLAYGTQADEVNSKLLMLGDIASGLSLPLGDLVYLYGTTMTQGRMYTRDLIQFMGRGIPIAEELAKQFGVTKDKVQELVSAGKVGAKEFDQAMRSMRADRFNNLMEAQSKSITGEIANLQDSIQLMFNEMGKASEGAMGKAINSANWIVEHYKEVGKVIAMLITTYGTYRAALIANAAVQGITTKGLAGYVSGLRIATVAQTAFNTVVKMNPYVLAASALVTLVGAIAIFRDRTSESEKAIKRHNAELERQNGLIEEQERKTREAINTLQDENSTRLEQTNAVKVMQSLYPSLFGNLDEETAKTKILTTAQRELANEREKNLLKMKEQAYNEARQEAERARKAQKEGAKYDQGGYLSQAMREAEEAERLALADLTKYQRELAEANLTSEQKRAREESRLKQMQEQRQRLVEEQSRQMGQVGMIVDPLLQVQIDALDDSINSVSNSLKGMAEVKTNTLQSEIANVTSELAKAEKHLSDLRAGNVQGLEDYAGEIEKTTKNITELQNKLTTLTGKKAGGRSASTRSVSTTNRDERGDFEKQVLEQAQRGANALALAGMDEFAKIEEQYNQTMQSIEQQKQAYMARFNATQVQANALYEAQEQQALQTREQAEQAYYDSLLKKHATYLEQRKAIEEKAQKDIDDLRRYGQSTGADVSGNIALVEEQKEIDLQAVDLAFAMKSDEFESWVNSISNMALETLEAHLETARTLLAEMEGQAGIDPDKLAQQRAKIAQLESSIKNQTKRDGKRTTKEWQDLYRTLQEVSRAFSEIGSEVGGVVGEVISSAGEIATSTVSMINGITELANWSVRATEMTAKGVAKSIQAVERATVVLAVVGAGVRIIQQVGKWLTKNTDLTKEQREEYQSLITITNQLADANRKLMESLSSDELQRKYKETVDIIKNSLSSSRDFINDFLNSGASKGFLGIGSKASEGVKLRKRLQDYKRELEKVTGVSWDKLKGPGRMEGMANLSVEQIKALQQNALLWSKLGDELQGVFEKILDAHGQLTDLERERLENLTSTTKEQLQDDILGFIDELDDSMAQPAESFERAMKNAMKRVLRDNIIAKEMDNFYKMFAEANVDGNLTVDEIQALKDAYMALVANAKKEWDNMSAVLGDSATDPRSASEKGIAQASQDSIDELVGLWHTSVQIASRHESKFSSYSEAVRDMQTKGWQDVRAIRDYTEAIEKNTRSIDTTMKDLSTNGVAIK